MIRDPSDGSVKEKPMPVSEPGMTGLPPVIDTKISGLPLESSRAAYQEKLERSREWLRQYRTNPESVTRLMGEGADNAET